MADDYDIKAAFEAIENELISSMIRNMRRHKLDEVDEDKQWAMWQAEQLKSLERYRRSNQLKFGSEFKKINARIEALIKAARDEGEMDQEIAILEAIKRGFEGRKATAEATAEFFKLNERKLEALIKATVDDMQKAEVAILRRANDQYRKIIYNAQVYANTGAGTYEKAVDMATRDMLFAGLQCVEYANGTMHTLSDYAEMAIQTAAKRAYLQGEGLKRQEWGVATVIMNKRGNPCPKCLPFCGKILMDDVWSGGNSDGISPVTGKKYQLMSKAIAAGLYHPRCLDSHSTYFEELYEDIDDKYTRKEIEQITERYRAEQKNKYAQRQQKRFARLEEYSLDQENREGYKRKAAEWRHVRFRTGNLDEKEYVDKSEISMMKGYSDLTENWKNTTMPDEGELIDLREYTVNGVTYTVDGKNVLLDYSVKEKEIAEILKKEFGGKISMVPRVLKPQGISTPDYIFRDESYDLKELSGTSKNLVYNVVAKKKRQASNFVLDISNCPLDRNEIFRQVDYVYWSRHTLFVNTIILIKDDKVIKVFKRNT